MTTNIQAIALAFSLAGGLVASAPAAAVDLSDGMHGWDDPEKAEFYFPDVDVKFLYPNLHWRKRDVYVDCDLLVKDGGKTLATTGFVAQFNAETQETIERLPEGVLGQLENWKGQMDYRLGRVKGVLTHTDSQHGIGVEVVKNAVMECRNNHGDHGVDINDLPELLGQ